MRTDPNVHIHDISVYTAYVWMYAHVSPMSHKHVYIDIHICALRK